MELVISIVIGVVAFLHPYFLYFEMFAWTTKGPKIFRTFPKDLFPQTKAMAANQGLYNGFLAAGLIWSMIIQDPVWKYHIGVFFLACVAVAGLYGSVTVSKKIFYIQAIPAIIGIVLILLYK